MIGRAFGRLSGILPHVFLPHGFFTALELEKGIAINLPFAHRPLSSPFSKQLRDLGFFVAAYHSLHLFNGGGAALGGFHIKVFLDAFISSLLLPGANAFEHIPAADAPDQFPLFQDR